MATHSLVCGILIIMMLAYYTKSCSTEEREALLSIDSECGWSGSNCCSYIGVICENGAVTNVSLRECSKSYANIAPNSPFFKLPHLREFVVFNLNMNSSIPDEIGNLAKLERLSVYGFRGDIPSSIGKLSKLDNLALNQGRSSKPIPKFIRKLRHLRLINLEDIGLTGGIPNFFRNMTSLRGLNIGKNRLSGKLPHFLFNEMHLDGIFTQDNLFEGSLPAILPESSDLYQIYLFNNKLSGSLPSWLSMMEVVKLSNNRFNGTIPEFQRPVEGRIPFHTLEVSFNSLSGEIPASLGDFPSLRRLDLSSNKLVGKIPEILLNSQTLTHADVSNNLIECPDPPTIFIC